MRFAGSQVDFSGLSLGSAAGISGAAAAAGVVDIGNSFASQRSKAPRYDQMSATVMANDAAIKSAGMEAEAAVMGTGLQALGQTKSSAMMAQAQIEAAEKQASAQKSSAMMGGIGSVLSAGIGLLSDESTKEDVKQLDTALEKLRSLRPVTFYYKGEYTDSPGRMHHGFIAQEFQKVLPDATYYDESIGKLKIDVTEVIGLLVRANQELEERIGMLEAKQALATV